MLILLGKISKYVYNSLYKGSNMNLDKCKPHWWHVYFKQYLILDSYFAVICTGIWLLRHKIIWNYFWSEFFLNLSLYSTNAKYVLEPTCNIQCCHMIWLSMILSEHCVLDTSIGIFLLSLIFVLPYWLSSLFFFLWFALYHFDERTVEYMYLFNS